MATDYDAPRQTDEESSTASLEELKTHRAAAQTATIDVDETEEEVGS